MSWNYILTWFKMRVSLPFWHSWNFTITHESFFGHKCKWFVKLLYQSSSIKKEYFKRETSIFVFFLYLFLFIRLQKPYFHYSFYCQYNYGYNFTQWFPFNFNVYFSLLLNVYFSTNFILNTTKVLFINKRLKRLPSLQDFLFLPLKLFEI